MFGHNDDQNNNQQDEPNDTIGVMPPVVPDPSVTAGMSMSSRSSVSPTGITSPDTNENANTPSAPSVPVTPSLVTPTTDSTSTDSSVEEPSNDSSALASTSTTPEPENSPATDDASSDDTSTDESDAADTDAPQADGDLMNLKQQALQQLSPLVGHLDQTPEEKFRTTMMMIQASDDSTLVKTAFEAAQAITDDKARAQALLDVINEINYFTQHKSE